MTTIVTIPCAIDSCNVQALLIDGYCGICDSKYCWYHREDPKFHLCLQAPRPRKLGVKELEGGKFEAERIHKLLDAKLIAAEVQLLRPESSCAKVDVPIEPQGLLKHTGCFNFHIFIDFADGARWVMRIRRLDRRLDNDDIIRLGVANEISTLNILASAGLSVPRAWARPMESALSPKLFYFYEEYVPGESARCSIDTNRDPNAPFHAVQPIRKANAAPRQPSEKMKAKMARHPAMQLPRSRTYIDAQIFVDAVARFHIDMEQLTFEKVGGLFDLDGEPAVGPLTTFFPLSNPASKTMGRFDTAQQMYIAVIDDRLQQIMDRVRYSPSYEIPRYLSLLDARQLVLSCDELKEGPWYLRHVDMEWRQFHITKDGQINGVLDWEWSRTVSKAEAFSSPPCFLSRNHHFSPLEMGRFERALVSAYTALGRPDLAKLVENGKMYKDLSEILFTDSLVGPSVRALLTAQTGQEVIAPYNYSACYSAWLVDALSRYENDENVLRLKERGKEEWWMGSDPSWLTEYGVIHI